MDPLAYLLEKLFLPDPEERIQAFRHDPYLRQVLPEVYRLQGVPQPPDHHPEGDVLTHTLLAVGALPAHADRRLALASLLHDVGKAETTQEIQGRIRAFGHDRAGADIAQRVLLRLAVPREEREDVVWLIRNHMFALSWQLKDLDHLTRRQWRLIRDPRFPLLLDLMEIDSRAAEGNAEKMAQVLLYRRAHAISDREGSESN